MRRSSGVVEDYGFVDAENKKETIEGEEEIEE